MAYRRRGGRVTAPKYIQGKTEQENENGFTVSQVSDKLTIYVQSLLELFTRSNSILTGQTVNCVLSSQTQVACTDGETVFFNPDVIKNALAGIADGKLDVKHSLKELAKIRGLNLHEVSHIIYSPRKGQLAWSEVERLQRDIDQDATLSHKFNGIPAFRLWNLLEDQRIESLYSAQYRNSVPYFNRLILEILLSDDSNQSSHMWHLWLYGRRYVSESIRESARAEFILATDITDTDIALWESLIDEYRSFIFPTDGRKVAPLLLQFMELWVKYFPVSALPESGTGADGLGGHGERREGAPTSVPQQRQAQERREEQDEKSALQGGSAEDKDSDDDDEDSEEGQGLSGSGDTDGQKNESSNDHNSDSSNDGNSGGAGSEGEIPQKRGNHSDTLEKLLQRELDESTNETVAESTHTLKQVVNRAERLKLDALFKNTESSAYAIAPPNNFKAISNALSTALRQLRSDNESSWEKGVPTGRLNIGLAIDAEAQDSDADVFDRWNDSGDDAPRVEIVILLDQSTSMRSSCYRTTSFPIGDDEKHESSLIVDASSAMWAIKLACQQNEIPCTVVGYSAPQDTKVLYRSHDFVPKNQVGVFSVKSFTDPSAALKIARGVFSASDAQNKILISISDGEWSCTWDEIDTIRSMHAEGVDSVFIALPSGSRFKVDQATGTVTVEHWWAKSLDHGVAQNKRWWSDQNPDEIIYSGKGYDHKVLLKVKTPADLAKQIGKAIISASL